MIIKDVRVLHSVRNTVLSAKCKVRRVGWDNVYFKVDSAYNGYVCEDASPFATALLLPSMKQGEDLVIEGAISKQLWAGMHTVMEEVLRWGIGLKPINIKAEELIVDTHEPTGVASFFSGGVDSFYTYLKHRHSPDPAQRIDSLLFINNSFDIDPRNTELWDLTLRNLRAIADQEHINLVVAVSNVNSQLLANILPWDYIHGACLAAMGQFLRKGFRKIYIPSTHSVEEQIPWGSNLALDENWSTETLTFEHDGSETTRANKIISYVARSPLALKYLRVCYKNSKDAYNCGKCDKCMRTMVSLYIAGALERAETLPHKIDTDLLARTPTIRGEHGGIFHNENLSILRERNVAPELEKAMMASLELTASLKENDQSWIRDKVVYFDHMYTRGYLNRRLSSMFGKKYS